MVAKLRLHQCNLKGACIIMWQRLICLVYLTPTLLLADVSTNTEFKLAVAKLNVTKGTFNGVIPFPVPYHASIQCIEGNKYKHLCGGSIIHPQIIMTAAHCFHETSSPKRVTAVVGSNLLSLASHPRQKVSAIILHEYYYPLQGRDIALVKLSTPLRLDGKKTDTISYNTTENLENAQRAYLISYGRKVKNLEAVDFTTLNSTICRKMGYPYVSATDLCARSMHGRGAGDGDSGSALVSPELDKLYGILSYGKHICRPKSIYVYTSMFRLVEWVDSHIKKLVG